MKKKFFRAAALLPTLALLLTLTMVPAGADGAQKAAVDSSEEVVYALLSADGAVESACAVTALNVTKAGQAVYYGPFSEVKNLTDTGAVSLTGDAASLEAGAGRFYFQGTLENTALPWSVAVTYALDGRETDPAALGGASGALTIHIVTAENPACAGQTDFFGHYLLQVSLTLDADKCANIAADGASVADSGGNKAVTFTVLPGAEGDLTLTADVTDFGMDGITLAAVPYDLSSALGDASALTDGLTQLSDAVTELSDGARKLSDGAADLAVGAAQLNTGASDYGAGLSELSGSSAALVSASEQIGGALQQLSASLSGADGGADLSSLSALPAALTQLSGAMGQLSGALGQLSDAYPAAYTALSQALDAIPGTQVPEADLAALSAANPNSAALQTLIESYTAAQTVRAVWQQTRAAFAAVQGALPTLKSSADTVKSGLDTLSAQLTAALQSNSSLQGLVSLTQGVSALAENYASFQQGLTGYTGGVDALAENWTELSDGIDGLADGSSVLQKGTRSLSDGAATLSGEAGKLPGEVEALTGGDGESFEPASFLSAKNGACSSVQFVLRTAAIEKPAAAEVPAAETVPNTFWQRLLSLFK